MSEGDFVVDNVQLKPGPVNILPLIEHLCAFLRVSRLSKRILHQVTPQDLASSSCLAYSELTASPHIIFGKSNNLPISVCCI